ncbi:unnamed protein product, partial [marine sediment metagenome]
MYEKRLVLRNEKIFSILILVLTFILFVVFLAMGIAVETIVKDK